MAIKYKDYYRILCVSRTATEEEIRKSFRRLARQWHPDVAGDEPDAETRFKEVNEAYEVLGDPEKRRRYDSLGSNWRPGAEFRPPPGFDFGSGAFRGGNFEFRYGEGSFSDFFHELFGQADPGRGAQFQSTNEGPRPRAKASAPKQQAESEIVVTLQEALEGTVRTIALERQLICTRCFGTGFHQNTSCTHCKGRGNVEKTEQVKIKIPAGVQEGQTLRVPVRSHDDGVAVSGGGEVYLRILFEDHPLFEVDGHNLVCDFHIPAWEAVLGTTVLIPTLEEKVQIRVPAGSQNAQKFRLRGKGLSDLEGERGDLVAVLRVTTPKQVSPAAKRLWEQLAKEGG